MGGQIRIGTSGYHYNHWKEIFYPQGMPKTKWLEYYVRHFDTVEINNSFYRLPEASTFVDWRLRAPKDFLYAVKFSRYGTHMKYLADPHASLNLFLERATQLGSLLGPILVQLPPNWKINLDRLAGFLGAAPAEHRWAIEFREPSWLTEEIYSLLRQHNAALCIHDRIPNHPRIITADWTYLRFHGGGINGDYLRETLQEAAGFIRRQADQGRDSYVYFNNDGYGFAIKNAKELRRMVTNQTCRPEEQPSESRTPLFDL